MASITFNNYDDDGKDVETKTIKSLNILVAGLTGSGKSSIIKSLCSSTDETDNMTKMSIRSVTKNITMYSNKKIVNPNDPEDEYMVNLFDTVGLGDNNIDVPTILKQIIEWMPKDLSKIDKIVFCFKMDRLRAKMSEELSILYNFFKMVGANPENFIVCLTFCDILSDDTILNFWNELKALEDLPMVKEVETVTYTSFPNIAECDKDESLVRYLQRKARISRRRVFESVILKGAKAFYPHHTMMKMPQVDFDALCNILRSFKAGKRSWFWGFIDNKTEQEEIMNQLRKLRAPLVDQDKKKETAVDKKAKT
ncbi:unnamed protein product [Didymodactylos carnosus]|uniref:Septin-type G domain-containing protein n=1 Tax=Didymodactylos carnosus TaxID=1234261 RepID=A0A815N1Z6_9BILA|nr:unnamed protein product [Didymodactylos carnosus]CAF1430670.1 unnamed protein product [Didymodactylos carnosus]CAF3708750.1 unnamed protein product [Didymodactylos carnosus]CAF4309440.1 unnamed protein product [Didymodactylos carnosus]